jgi:LuxR family quorum-sensing system transcriptional regulator CciR
MGLYDVALEFERRVQLCESDAELSTLLGDAVRELGFEHYAIVEQASFCREEPQFISLDNYPEAWAEEFVGGLLYLDDPVLQASQRTQKAFRWTDVAKLLKVNHRHARVIERSQRYGMGSGMTVPANVPGEPCGSCSFAVKRGKDLPEDRLRAAELIAIDAVDTSRRLRGLPHIGAVPHLSRRQRQCIRLLSSGKNDKEIARSLKLSPETTKRYVATARQVYRATTRAELVTKALRDGQIGFD